MNWLAHVFHSEPEVEFRLGNPLADIVRGKELRRMSPGFRLGALRHRQIDAFTDAHPVVKRSRSRVSPGFAADFAVFFPELQTVVDEDLPP